MALLRFHIKIRLLETLKIFIEIIQNTEPNFVNYNININNRSAYI